MTTDILTARIITYLQRRADFVAEEILEVETAEEADRLMAELFEIQQLAADIDSLVEGILATYARDLHVTIH